MAVKADLFRPATLHDGLFVGRLLKEFYAEKGGIYGIPYDHASTLRTVQGVIDHGICLVGPTSCAGAILVPFPYNGDVLVAHVVFWYFKNAREIEIFERLMQHCAAAGAVRITAASHYPENRIGPHYSKFGMEASESTWLGRIDLAKTPAES